MISISCQCFCHVGRLQSPRSVFVGREGKIKDRTVVKVEIVLAVGQKSLALACWKFDNPHNSKCLVEVPLKRLIFLGIHLLRD